MVWLSAKLRRSILFLRWDEKFDGKCMKEKVRPNFTCSKPASNELVGICWWIPEHVHIYLRIIISYRWDVRDVDNMYVPMWIQNCWICRENYKSQYFRGTLTQSGYCCNIPIYWKFHLGKLPPFLHFSEGRQRYFAAWLLPWREAGIRTRPICESQLNNLDNQYEIYFSIYLVGFGSKLARIEICTYAP